MSSKSTTSIIAMCAALPLPAGGETAPEWIHLLPAGEIRTNDGRGPYRVPSAAELIRTSLQGDARLPLDENHSTDLAAPNGEPSPARGWITEMQNREDGIWGKVDWTGSGKALMADRAYRHISPVIAHDPKGNVVGLLRASLVNQPNLRGLTALHQEKTMDLLTKIRKLLGLPETADESAICEAISGIKDTATVATQQVAAALAPIIKVVGLADAAKPDEIVVAIQAMSDPAKVVPVAQVVALQSQLNALLKDKSVAFVDNAIKAGKIGLKPLRDHYIARHMSDPAGVEKEIAAMVALQASGAGIVPPGNSDPAALTEDEEKIVSLMGIDREAFKKQKAAKAKTEEAL